MKGIVGKGALITGAASGIGKAAAFVFAREGARVTLVDINGHGVEDTARAVRAAGGEATAVQADVSYSEGVARAMQVAQEVYGPVLLAFNNAGVEGAFSPLVEHPDDEFDRTMRINLKGIWLCMKAQIPPMVERRSGNIVNMASALGMVGTLNQPAYVASKHAVVGLTKAVALEYVDKGIRVNCVCPGLIATPLVLDRAIKGDPELEKLWLASEPIGRFGTPEEVAEAALWLCSDAASFVTGSALTVDGGYLAR